MKVFIGMETSGAGRRAFAARGHDVISCDILPAEDGGTIGRHIQGDVFEVLESLRPAWWPDLAIFHPDCTYLTSSAEWAYGDGPYHQKVKPGTLVGAARREARERALDDVRKILALPIKRRAVENPIGAITRIRKFTQIIQPNQFGHDASKKTGLILDGLMPLRPTQLVAPRMVNGLPRWANQTDSGQNRLSPGANRWKDRARSYPGILNAMAEQWT